MLARKAFLGLCAVAAVLLAWGGLRLRERRTRRRQRELEELVEKRTAETRKLSLAVQHSPASVVITDREGLIEYVNPAFERATGYTAAEALGKTLRILKSDFHPPSFYEELWLKILRGETWHGEFCNKRKNGEVYWEEASISPIRGEGGEITHFVAVQLDISVLMATERKLEESKEAAESASRAKSAFLASMSHEIRTPMNAVLGLTRLVLDGRLAPEQREYLTTARSSGEHLLGLIEQILDLSRIEAKKLDLHPAPVDLRSLVAEVLGLLSQQAEKKGLRLESRVDDAVPVWVSGDPLRLRQVLLNLAGNAVKFTASGSVRIEVGPQPGGGDRLLVRVVDTGIGLSEEERTRVFDRFTQADESTTRKFGGSGLGLAISSELVALMEGEIGVESTPGAGSTFWFTARLPATDAPAPALPPAMDPPGAKRSRRVLVVEDNTVNMLVVTRTLARFGHQAEGATTGAEALEKIEAGPPFDIALLDLHMPDIDGVDLAQRIRAGEAETGKRLPLYALTADARSETEKACREAGMDGFLTKPFSPEALDAALGSLP